MSPLRGPLVGLSARTRGGKAQTPRCPLSHKGARACVLSLVAAAALGILGCTSLSDWVHNDLEVGPNYTPPPVETPAQWIDAKDANVRHGDPNVSAWWEVFDDPILNRLLHDSYANNLTIRAAGSQILQAQIARFIARSELLPQAQNAIFGYSRNMASETGELRSGRVRPPERRLRPRRSCRSPVSPRRPSRGRPPREPAPP